MNTPSARAALVSLTILLLTGFPVTTSGQQEIQFETETSPASPPLETVGAVQASDNTTDNLNTVEAAVRSYEKAFNAHDASRVVRHWMPDGVFERPGIDLVLNGAAEIEAEFKSIFEKHPSVKLELKTQSIEYVGPNVAVERGISVGMIEGGDVAESQYEAVFVKKDNQWLLDRVSDAEPILSASASLKLKELEFMTGDWSDQGEDYRVVYRCNWTQKHSFLNSKFHVKKADGTESSGLQIIGWDPIEKQIKSWIFDSDGTVGSGRWEKRDDHWVVQVVETLQNGKKGSHTVTIRPLPNEGYGWKKTNRVADGKPLPNIPEVVIRPLPEEGLEMPEIEIRDDSDEYDNGTFVPAETGDNQ